MPAAITQITPIMGYRGAAGTQFTVVGTGFGALQGGGGVTIGAVAAIIDSWSDTAIACRADDSPATPLGPQDVVVTEDGATSDTLENALYIYNETDEDNNDEMETGAVSALYIDGTHVGELSDNPVIGAVEERLLPYPAQDLLTPKAWRILGKSCPVGVRLAQADGANLAIALGGTWTAASRTLDVDAVQGNQTEHSLLIVQTNGIIIMVPRAFLVSPAQITLNAEEWQGLPLGFMAEQVDDAGATVLKAYLP